MDDAQRSPLRFFLVFSLTYLFVAKVKPTVWISVCFFMQRSSILQAQVGLWKRKCSTLETQWGQCDNLSFGVFIHHVLKLHFLSKVGLFSCFLLLFVPFKSQVCSSPESYWWNAIRHQSGTLIQWYRWVSLINAFFAFCFVYSRDKVLNHVSHCIRHISQGMLYASDREPFQASSVLFPSPCSGTDWSVSSVQRMLFQSWADFWF